MPHVRQKRPHQARLFLSTKFTRRVLGYALDDRTVQGYLAVESALK